MLGPLIHGAALRTLAAAATLEVASVDSAAPEAPALGAPTARLVAADVAAAEGSSATGAPAGVDAGSQNMIPFSSQDSRPSSTERAIRYLRTSSLRHMPRKWAAMRRRAPWQNRSARETASRPSGLPPREKLWARERLAAMANNSAPMSTARNSNACFFSSFPW